MAKSSSLVLDRLPGGIPFVRTDGKRGKFASLVLSGRGAARAPPEREVVEV
jgi:hypothetical protein